MASKQSMVNFVRYLEWLLGRETKRRLKSRRKLETKRWKWRLILACTKEVLCCSLPIACNNYYLYSLNLQFPHYHVDLKLIKEIISTLFKCFDKFSVHSYLMFSEVSAPKGFKLDKAVSVRYHFDHNDDIFVMDAKSIGNLGRYFNVSLQLCLSCKTHKSIFSALLWTERDRSKCFRWHSWPSFPMGGIFYQKVRASRHRAVLGLQLWNRQSSWQTTGLLLWIWQLPRTPFISCGLRLPDFYFFLIMFVMFDDVSQRFEYFFVLVIKF